MKIMRRTLPALAGALLVTAACGDSVPDEGVVARAGDYVLTVDHTVDLLVDQENLPAQAEVIQALADLWMDYTLLADLAARDSTFQSLELANLVWQQLEQQMIFELRDSVMQVDTAITDAELRRIYAEEAPGAELEASHILLGFPQDATPTQRDSVRAQMEELLGRVRAGESFEALATQYSQDRGSATQGGSLGTFGRGEMVRPFEEAVFALDPGEISDIVETPFGLHIIRLDDRRTADFETVRDQFRVELQQQRFFQAESLFVAGVEERAGPQVQEGSVQLAKDLAAEPGQRLAGRAARRALVEYDGGAYTVGEFQTFIQSRAPQFRQQVQSGTDEQIESLLQGLVQRELLVEEARNAGLAPSEARVDSLVSEARGQLRQAARDIGVMNLDRAPGEPLEPAVSRAVQTALEGILTGARDVIPLGQVGFQLRQREATATEDSGIGEAMLRIGEIRASRSLAPLEQTPDTSASTDTIS